MSDYADFTLGKIYQELQQNDPNLLKIQKILKEYNNHVRANQSNWNQGVFPVTPFYPNTQPWTQCQCLNSEQLSNGTCSICGK